MYMLLFLVLKQKYEKYQYSIVTSEIILIKHVNNKREHFVYFWVFGVRTVFRSIQELKTFYILLLNLLNFV